MRTVAVLILIMLFLTTMAFAQINKPQTKLEPHVHLPLVQMPPVPTATAAATATPVPTSTNVPTATPTATQLSTVAIPTLTEAVTDTPVPTVPATPTVPTSTATPTTTPTTTLAPTPALETLKGVACGYSKCVRYTELGADWRFWDDLPYYFNCPGLDNVPKIHFPVHWQSIKDGDLVLTGDSEYIVGFNECDLPDQCNAPISDVIVWWREIEEYYPDKKLVAPVPSELSYNGEYIQWLVDWWDAYEAKYGEPPRVDAFAAHCYGIIGPCEEVIGATVRFAREKGVGEVWVTEFGHWCSPGYVDCTAALAFMDRMVTYFKSEPLITRYAWFLSFARTDSTWDGMALRNENGWTPLGLQYMQY